VWEQRLINLQQCLLIIDKQVKQVILVLLRKINQPYPILGQLCQSQQRLLKILSFLHSLVHIMKFLLGINFILQPPPHYLLPHFFNTLNKQLLQVIPLNPSVGLLARLLPLQNLFLVQNVLE